MRRGFPPAVPAWDDANIAGFSLGAGASAPDFTTAIQGGILAPGFDGGSTMEQLYGVIELPHDYKEGSDIQPHVHWCPSDTGAGNVVWRLEYTWCNAIPATVFPGANTITGTSAAATVAKTNTPVDIGTGLISGAGMKISSHFAFRLYRDPNNVDGLDTYGSDALLISFGLHYQVDALGSRLITTK